MRAFLAIGSNLGDRWGHLAFAIGALHDLDQGLAVSPVYETVPVGGPDGQGPYLNAVVGIDTQLSPHELLALANEIEAEAGRVRRERWGSRTLDIDIVVIDGARIDDDVLVVPHPRMGERAFVLAPLEDLEPSAVPAGWRKRLAEQLTGVKKVGYLLSPEVHASVAGAAKR